MHISNRARIESNRAQIELESSANRARIAIVTDALRLPINETLLLQPADDTAADENI